MATRNKKGIKAESGNEAQDKVNKKPKAKLVLKKAKVDQVIIALDTENAAKAIGVSAAMMKKMRSEGSGPAITKIGTKCVYLVENLKSFLRKNTTNE